MPRIFQKTVTSLVHVPSLVFFLAILKVTEAIKFMILSPKTLIFASCDVVFYEDNFPFLTTTLTHDYSIPLPFPCMDDTLADAIMPHPLD